MKRERKTIKLIITLFIYLVCFCSLGFADTIRLKSGTEVEGKIVERTDEHIKVYTHGIIITYPLSEILYYPEEEDSPGLKGRDQVDQKIDDSIDVDETLVSIESQRHKEPLDQTETPLLIEGKIRQDGHDIGEYVLSKSVKRV